MQLCDGKDIRSKERRRRACVARRVMGLDQVEGKKKGRTDQDELDCIKEDMEVTSDRRGHGEEEKLENINLHWQYISLIEWE